MINIKIDLGEVGCELGLSPKAHFWCWTSGFCCHSVISLVFSADTTHRFKWVSVTELLTGWCWVVTLLIHYLCVVLRQHGASLSCCCLWTAWPSTSLSWTNSMLLLLAVLWRVSIWGKMREMQIKQHKGDSTSNRLTAILLNGIKHQIKIIFFKRNIICRCSISYKLCNFDHILWHQWCGQMGLSKFS